MELFLQLNLCDYNRYLCEITVSQTMKEEYIRETEMNFKKFFSLAEDSNLHVVNPSFITAHYHYALFQYEILNKKAAAIQYLKDQYEILLENLDLAYKLYVDSYALMELIMDTQTTWIVLNEELISREKKEKEEEKERENNVI